MGSPACGSSHPLLLLGGRLAGLAGGRLELAFPPTPTVLVVLAAVYPGLPPVFEVNLYDYDFSTALSFPGPGDLHWSSGAPEGPQPSSEPRRRRLPPRRPPPGFLSSEPSWRFLSISVIAASGVAWPSPGGRHLYFLALVPPGSTTPPPSSTWAHPRTSPAAHLPGGFVPRHAPPSTGSSAGAERHASAPGGRPPRPGWRGRGLLDPRQPGPASSACHVPGGRRPGP